MARKIILQLSSEKTKSIRYSETDPGWAMGGIYLSKAYVDTQFPELEGKAPKQIEISIAIMEE